MNIKSVDSKTFVELFITHHAFKRSLYVLTGISGSGKTTWVKEHWFEEITFSADEFRKKLFGYPIKAKDWQEISLNKKVFNHIEEIVRFRANKELNTIIDVTNTHPFSHRDWKRIAKENKLQLVFVHFDIDKEICFQQNEKRKNSFLSVAYVSEVTLNKQYSLLEEAKKNHFWWVLTITVRKKENWEFDISQLLSQEELNEILKQKDFSQGELNTISPQYYHSDKTFIFGDIHGVKEAIDEVERVITKNPNGLFVFCWDMFDKGVENTRLLKLLFKWKDEGKYLYLLEGNHERFIREYLYWKNFSQGDKGYHLIEELKNNFSLKQLKDLQRMFRQYITLKFEDDDSRIKFLQCTHGGIKFPLHSSSAPLNELLHLSPKTFINGNGEYSEVAEIDKEFMKNTLHFQKDNIIYYQVHGHRNVNDDSDNLVNPLPVLNGRTYNLEQGVTKKWYFAYLKIDENSDISYYMVKSSFNYDELKKERKELLPDYPISKEEQDEVNKILEIKNSELVKIHDLEGGITSINFKAEAFHEKKWNEITTHARWLFVYSHNNKIMARSYEKFFNIWEFDTTSLDIVKKEANYPISIYKKENGFLGIVAYNKLTDEVEYLTKSGVNIEMRKIIKATLKQYEKAFLPLLREGYTMVFEIVDPINDLHYVNYEQPCAYLLDIFKNTLKANKFKYQSLQKWYQKNIIDSGLFKENATKLYLKELADIVHTPEALEEFFKDTIYNQHEGFVLEDNTENFPKMWKWKTFYYSFWKSLSKNFAKIKYTIQKKNLIENKDIIQVIEENMKYKPFVEYFFSMHSWINLLNEEEKQEWKKYFQLYFDKIKSYFLMNWEDIFLRDKTVGFKQLKVKIEAYKK